MAAGTELCPHCRRPFKRLRAHLPHCKAAPAAPAAGPRAGPGGGPAAPGSGAPEPSPAPRPRPAPGSGPRAVRDVARSLDLHPEEVADVPRRLRAGVKVVIEKHRARVVREQQPRSRGERTEPGAAPRQTALKSPGKEPRSRGAAGSGTASSKGGKSASKATKTPREPAESSDGPGDLVRLEGRDKSRAGGERLPLEARVGPEPPACALHPRSLRLPAAETPGNELSLPGPRGEAVPEPTVSPGTAPGLALPRTPPAQLTVSPGTAPGLALPRTPQTQPTVSPGTAPGLALPRTPRTQLTVSPGTAPGLALPRTPPAQPTVSPGTAPGLALPHAPRTQLTVSPGTAPGLALPRTPPAQPPCSALSSARGLEWFPDLYPESLGIFPGKSFHEDVRMAVETPKGGLAQGQQGPLSERPLMEVRLGELPTWISTCSFSPQGLLGAAQRAWSSYCAKYIHVKQGGPAGISMLLAGYCLLSYGWNYQHFKRHRWRKYH